MDSREYKSIPSSNGGNSFLELLSQYGVDCLFFNPGSDYYPVLEELSKFEIEGRESPKQIMCLTEHLALSMAHGYAMKTRKAQGVMVHVGLGTMELGGALHNISRGREPALIIAGRSPYTFEDELEGSRDRPYHWDQELFDQLGVARQFVKWTYELKTNSNLHHVVARALQVANTEPMGPVYLVLPRELLAEKQERVKILPVSRYRPPELPSSGKRSLESIAEVLLNSEAPIILTDYLGRNVEAVARLVELAELLGAAVIEPQRKRMNFPADHSLYLPGYPRSILESADAILLLDVDVPWSPSTNRIRKDARIVQIDIDPTKSGLPLWGFPVDISLGASTVEALPDLLSILKERQTEKFSSVAKERIEKIRSQGKKIREDLKRQAIPNGTVMKVQTVISEVNALRNPDTIIMSEGVTSDPVIASYIETTIPGTFFALGGSSLGDGLGNALGLKFASPEIDVICIVSDGGYVYSNPTSVFWASKKHGLPILTVILNNGGYRAMKESVEKAYPGSVSIRKNLFSGVRMEPQPDLLMAAGACGISGLRVANIDELSNALRLGLEETRVAKKSMVIDAMIDQV